MARISSPFEDVFSDPRFLELAHAVGKELALCQWIRFSRVASKRADGFIPACRLRHVPDIDRMVAVGFGRELGDGVLADAAAFRRLCNRGTGRRTL